jgi:hypothetical protein
MWEKDKKLIAAYRECMQTFVQSLKDGDEDADYESACVVEAEKLQSYTSCQMDYYQQRHASELSEKK